MPLGQIIFFPLQKLICIKLRVNVIILILVEQRHEEYNSAR